MSGLTTMMNTNEKMKKQKNHTTIVWIFSLFIVMFLFTGCGGESSQPGNENEAEGVSGAAVSGDSVSGNAVSVSGGAVSGNAIQEQNTETDIKNEKELFKRTKTQPYANDHHIFEGDKLQGIYQYSLTGEEENYYETGWLSCPDVVWVDNECILYFCDYDDDDTPNQFYYAPLAGGKGKKQILLNQKVLLAEAGELSYFVAKRGNDVYFGKNEKLCKVNIKTKKSEKIKLGESKYVSLSCDFNGQPCIQGDKVYFVGNDKNIYQFDLKQDKAKKIGEKLYKDYYYAPQIAVDEHNMYFGMERDDSGSDEIVKVSLDTGEMTTLVTIDEVEGLVKKYGSKQSDKFISANVIKWGDTLYFVLEAIYDSDDPNLLSEHEHLVFHCLAKDGSGITFEKEMSEFEKKELHPYLEEDIDDEWKILNGSLVQVLGENQFVIEYVEEEKTRFVLYDTKTNQSKKFGEETAEYGLLRASGYEEYEAYDRSHF